MNKWLERIPTIGLRERLGLQRKGEIKSAYCTEHKSENTSWNFCSCILKINNRSLLVWTRKQTEIDVRYETSEFEEG